MPGVVGARARPRTTFDVRPSTFVATRADAVRTTVVPVRHVRLLPRVDVAIALVLAAYGIAEAALGAASAAWFAVVLAATLPLAWRRRHPVAVIAWTLAVVLVPTTLGVELTDSVLPLPLMVVIAYTGGREADSGRAAAVAGVAIIATIVAAGLAAGAVAENSTAGDVVALLVIVGGAVLAGHLMRVRHGENVRLQRLTAELAAERDARATAAVAEERARVARELHDIVAHSVSLIAVQAAAADELLGRDEARARASLRAVQDTARGALTEMRRLLSILRADDDPGLAPPPGLSAVGELIEQVRAGGLPVALHEQGPRAALPAGLDLSAYRIVQEALTNVLKHAAGAPTDVLVQYGDTELLLEVASDNGTTAGARGDGNGHGLAGMRERARIYGGTLEAGREGSRFVVRARLPIAAASE